MGARSSVYRRTRDRNSLLHTKTSMGLFRVLLTEEVPHVLSYIVVSSVLRSHAYQYTDIDKTKLDDAYINNAFASTITLASEASSQWLELFGSASAIAFQTSATDWDFGSETKYSRLVDVTITILSKFSEAIAIERQKHGLGEPITNHRDCLAAVLNEKALRSKLTATAKDVSGGGQTIPGLVLTTLNVILDALDRLGDGSGEQGPWFNHLPGVMSNGLVNLKNQLIKRWITDLNNTLATAGFAQLISSVKLKCKVEKLVGQALSAELNKVKSSCHTRGISLPTPVTPALDASMLRLFVDLRSQGAEQTLGAVSLSTPAQYILAEWYPPKQHENPDAIDPPLFVTLNTPRSSTHVSSLLGSGNGQAVVLNVNINVIAGPASSPVNIGTSTRRWTEICLDSTQVQAFFFRSSSRIVFDFITNVTGSHNSCGENRDVVLVVLRCVEIDISDSQCSRIVQDEVVVAVQFASNGKQLHFCPSDDFQCWTDLAAKYFDQQGWTHESQALNSIPDAGLLLLKTVLFNSITVGHTHTLTHSPSQANESESHQSIGLGLHQVKKAHMDALESFLTRAKPVSARIILNVENNMSFV